VFAPSKWDPSLVGRSAALPKRTLELEFVHGYEGRNITSSNLHYNKHGQMVYHVAAVGIVHSSKSHEQRFFLGHNDDILCLTLHPDGVLAASGQVGTLPCAGSV
jgi:HELP motif